MVSFYKDHKTFFGIKLSNGTSTIKYKITILDISGKYVDKQYCFGAYFNFGGTIKNVSIYSGIGYHQFRYKYARLSFVGGNLGSSTLAFVGKDIKFNVLNIPINIDYNLNVYKQKLYAKRINTMLIYFPIEILLSIMLCFYKSKFLAMCLKKSSCFWSKYYIILVLLYNITIILQYF